MKHPFDDFLPPSTHIQREDRRVIRIGIVLVAVVSIATAAAFATTLGGWRGLLENRSTISTRWDDAQLRVQAFVRSQKDMKDSIESATELEQFVDGVPRSILLWELTQFLPEHSILNDIRLETRSRQVEEEKKKLEECKWKILNGSIIWTLSSHGIEVKLKEYHGEWSIRFQITKRDWYFNYLI